VSIKHLPPGSVGCNKFANCFFGRTEAAASSESVFLYIFKCSSPLHAQLFSTDLHVLANITKSSYYLNPLFAVEVMESNLLNRLQLAL